MSYDNLTSDIYSHFKNGMSLFSDVFSYPVEIEYRNVQRQKKVNVNEAWIRISTDVVEESQKTIANPIAQFEINGLVFVQIFVPINELNGDNKGRVLSDFVRSIFRKKKTENCVVFKNTRIKELDPEKDYLRFNVISEYEFIELV